MNIAIHDLNSSPERRAPRLLYAVTSSVSAGLLRGQLSQMRKRGFDVHLASAPGPELRAAAAQEGATVHSIPMRREIFLFHDIASLARMWWLLVRLHPDIVNASTGKAGLLAEVAAVLSGVPCRVHVLRGLRSETLRGFKRSVVRLTELIACACAHRVICISPSLRCRAVELGLVSERKSQVFGAGSSNGLVAERFQATPERVGQAHLLRQQLGIPVSAPVIGFVGRLTRDKGIEELVDAYLLLKPRVPLLCLLLVGPYEDGDPVDQRTRLSIETTPGIVVPGQVDDVVPYHHLMDVLAFPTHREGFGTTSLEAAAAGKPVVTTNATGAIDSVVDGVTGFIVPKGDAKALAGALGRLLDNPELSRQMGEAGRQRVLRDFRPEDIWAGIEGVYRELLRRTQRRSAGDSRKRAEIRT